uniref:Mediator of RNA polymerase II transcription subunit 7 n=1 Tax=Populus trichocarpa TaxID=3694 RepID=U5GBU4_POPTR
MTIGTYPPLPPFYKLYKDYIENPKSAPKPPPPFEGTYVCYGGNYTKELRSFNRELQLHILDLAERPSQYARKVEDISLIFKNLHHFLNSLRPHQARATLIHILEL